MAPPRPRISRAAAWIIQREPKKLTRIIFDGRRRCDLEERFVVIDRRVVHEDVEGTEPVNSCGDRSCRGCRTRYVTFKVRDAIVTQSLKRPSAFHRVAPNDQHGRSSAQHHARDLETNACRTPGNDGHLAAKRQFEPICDVMAALTLAGIQSFHELTPEPSLFV